MLSAVRVMRLERVCIEYIERGRPKITWDRIVQNYLERLRIVEKLMKIGRSGVSDPTLIEAEQEIEQDKVWMVLGKEGVQWSLF